MAAEMVAGAGLLLDERELPRGIQTAAETAFHIIPVFVLLFIGAQLCAQGVGRANHAVSACRRRAVNGQIVGADHLGREQTGQQRNPPFPEMQRERLFAWASPSKCRYFRKASQIASASSSPLSVPGQASAADRPFSHGASTGGFCPRTDFHRADWTAYTSWFFRHPFLPGKPVFRGEKSRGMRAPQSIQCGTPGQLFFCIRRFRARATPDRRTWSDGRRRPTRRTASSAYRPRTTCARGR